MLKQSKFANNGTTSQAKRKIQLKYDAKKRYGLDIEEAKLLREQPCKICGVKAKKMCIDHKIPGTYRGILCQQCNTRLGWFEKLSESILEYVKTDSVN